MPLTAQGLSIPKLDDIKEDNAAQLKSATGVDLDTTENSIAGIMNSIFALSMADAYELAQSIYDSRDIYKAQGSQLDILASYLGTSRIGAGRTKVAMQLTGDNGANIPAGMVVSTQVERDKFTLPIDFRLATNNANTVKFHIATVLNNADYTVTINGVDHTYASDADATEAEIIAGLQGVISSAGGQIFTVNGSNLMLQAASSGVYTPLQTLNVNFTSNFEITEIIGVADFYAQETGAIPAPSGLVTIIETPSAGLSSVTNPLDGDLGRSLETDEELRQRLIEVKSRSSSATVNAIAAAVQEVANVSSVTVIENVDILPDGDSRPPKSFEAIVLGGLDQEIADAIFSKKPAGIEAHGNTVLAVDDIIGNSHTVKFTRPTPLYITVDVEYTLYDEETFPDQATAHQTIKDTVLAFGNKLGADDDVISRRFIGDIYKAVDGLQDVVVKIASDPNEVIASPTTETTIPIGVSEYPNFDTTRITVSDVSP